MANSTIQLKVEDWIRTEWMPMKFGQPFIPRRLRLTTGGTFDFDAVSQDGKIVANISTSSSITSSGKNASAKMQKLRSDMLFLLLVNASIRLIVLTEENMCDLCLKEKRNGRMPQEIDFVRAEIPDNLRVLLLAAKRAAADEVTPR